MEKYYIKTINGLAKALRGEVVDKAKPTDTHPGFYEIVSDEYYIRVEFGYTDGQPLGMIYERLEGYDTKIIEIIEAGSMKPLYKKIMEIAVKHRENKKD